MNLARDFFVDQTARVETTNGVVGKRPIAVIEAKTVVDHCHRVGRALVIRRTMKDHLAAVAVAGPLIKTNAPWKMEGRSFTRRRRRSGRKSATRVSPGMPGKREPNWRPAQRAPAGPPRRMQAKDCGQSNPARLQRKPELLRANPQPGQPRCQHLVGKNARVLRVVLEFYDVASAIFAKHQPRLRCAAHPADDLPGTNPVRTPSISNIPVGNSGLGSSLMPANHWSWGKILPHPHQFFHAHTAFRGDGPSSADPAQNHGKTIATAPGRNPHLSPP